MPELHKPAREDMLEKPNDFPSKRVILELLIATLCVYLPRLRTTCFGD